MVKQRSRSQVRENRLRYKVQETVKSHWKNSTISSKGVSSCIFTHFYHHLTKWMENFNSNPEYSCVWVQVLLHFPALNVLICNVFSVLWKWVFSFSPLFLPMLSLNANNYSSRTFCTVGHSDFYARAVAPGAEESMYLPVLSGRNVCLVWLCF